MLAETNSWDWGAKIQPSPLLVATFISVDGLLWSHHEGTQVRWKQLVSEHRFPRQSLCFEDSIFMFSVVAEGALQRRRRHQGSKERDKKEGAGRGVTNESVFTSIRPTLQSIGLLSVTKATITGLKETGSILFWVLDILRLKYHLTNFITKSFSDNVAHFGGRHNYRIFSFNILIKSHNSNLKIQT